MAIIGILIIFFVGGVVINRMANDFKAAETFCIDKEGFWNVTKEDGFLDVIIIDCDNESYGLPTVAV